MNGSVAGTTYQFSGFFNMPVGPVGSSANVVIVWHSLADCDDNLEVDAASPALPGLPGWQESSGSAVAPPLAVSAEFVVVSGLAPFSGRVEEEDVAIVQGEYDLATDRFFFGPQQPVPAMTAVWLGVLGLASLLVARRGLKRTESAPAWRSGT